MHCDDVMTYDDGLTGKEIPKDVNQDANNVEILQTLELLTSLILIFIHYP